MSEYTMSVGQAHELEITLRKAGFSAGDVSKMVQSEELCRSILAVLRGQATVEGVKHLIDCDTEPFIPENWSIHPEDQIGSRVSGKLEFDPEKVSLHLADGQKTGCMIGHDLKAMLQGQLVLPANVLDYLLAHPEAIPESCKGKFVFFWGTIYRDSGGNLVVRYLHWNGDRWNWNWNYYWLDFEWHVSNPAAVSAS